MAVKTPTQWSPPSGIGYINPSSGALIVSQSGISITSQSGVSLIVNSEVYQPEFLTSWTLTPKNRSNWQPGSGQGYLVNVGNENFVTNNGLFLTDNLGNQVVTTPTYDIGKYATKWTESEA